MRLTETEEQQDLRAMCRAVLAEHCPPSLVRAVKVAPDRVEQSLLRALGEAGLLGLPFAERHGGQGAGWFEAGIFFAEAGRVLCPGSVLGTVVFGLAVQDLAPPEVVADLLPRVCAGDLVGAVALWNPADAADLRPSLTVTRAGDGHLVSGVLPAVPHGARADLVLAAASAVDPGEPDRRVVVLLTPGGPGRRDQETETMAQDRQARIELTDHPVPADRVWAAADGHGYRPDQIARVASLTVALQCMEMTGGGAEVLRRTVDHVATRNQFGRPIGSFQAVQHLLADAHIGLAGAELAAQQALWWLAEGRPAPRELAIAVMTGSRAYKAATLTAHQVHGGMGYVLETDLHLWTERAKTAEVLHGGPEVAEGWLEAALGLTR